MLNFSHKRLDIRRTACWIFSIRSEKRDLTGARMPTEPLLPTLYFMDYKMSESPLRDLSRRERQIMEVVYERQRVDAAEIQEALPEPPSYSAVRALLRILIEKGHLTTMKEGNKLVYEPVQKKSDVRRSVLAQVVDTYFNGSAPEAVSALLDLSDRKMSKDEIDALISRIEDARKEGR